MEENIRINFCKYCKKKNDRNCMSLKVENYKDLCIYACANYQNDIQLELYKTYIRFDFYDDNGNYIAVIKPKTPKDVIVELRKHYDFVRNKE